MYQLNTNYTRVAVRSVSVTGIVLELDFRCFKSYGCIRRFLCGLKAATNGDKRIQVWKSRAL